MEQQRTENQAAGLESESLGQKIELIIRKLPPQQVNFNEIVEIVGKDSLILLAIFLSLIFLVPVSIPGVSTVFGAGILLIGVARLLNLKPWLPDVVARRQMSSELLRVGLGRALVWFRRLEKISRPHRLPQLAAAGWVIPVNHLSFLFRAAADVALRACSVQQHPAGAGTDFFLHRNAAARWILHDAWSSYKFRNGDLFCSFDWDKRLVHI